MLGKSTNIAIHYTVAWSQNVQSCLTPPTSMTFYTYFSSVFFFSIFVQLITNNDNDTNLDLKTALEVSRYIHKLHHQVFFFQNLELSTPIWYMVLNFFLNFCPAYHEQWLWHHSGLENCHWGKGTSINYVVTFLNILTPPTNLPSTYILHT